MIAFLSTIFETSHDDLFFAPVEAHKQQILFFFIVVHRKKAARYISERMSQISTQNDKWLLISWKNLQWKSFKGL